MFSNTVEQGYLIPFKLFDGVAKQQFKIKFVGRIMDFLTELSIESTFVIDEDDAAKANELQKNF